MVNRAQCHPQSSTPARGTQTQSTVGNVRTSHYNSQYIEEGRNREKERRGASGGQQTNKSHFAADEKKPHTALKSYKLHSRTNVCIYNNSKLLFFLAD